MRRRAKRRTVVAATPRMSRRRRRRDTMPRSMQTPTTAPHATKTRSPPHRRRHAPRARTGAAAHARAARARPASPASAAPDARGAQLQLALDAGAGRAGAAAALQLLLAQRDELAADRALATARRRSACTVLRCERAAVARTERVHHAPAQRAAQARPAPACSRVRRQFPQRRALAAAVADAGADPVGHRRPPGRARVRSPPTSTVGRDRAADRLAPGQSATVQLDVVEPAPRIVAFTFDFR